MKTIPKIILTALIGILSGFFSLQVWADGDTTELQMTRNAVADAIAAEESYTIASYSAFETVLTGIGGLAAVDAMLAAPTSQNDVDVMNAALQDGLALLVTQESLDGLIAKNNLAIAAYYENRNDYTRTSHNAFKTVVDAYGGYLTVNQLINDPEASQEDVDSMIAGINAALVLLVDQGDVTALEAAYETAFEADLTPFIPISVTAYSAELDRIYEILIGNDASQADIDEAVADVDAAWALLIPFADKTALSAAILEAESLKAEKYTISSYHVFSSLLTEAINLENNPDAIQGEVDQMILDIDAATEALVKMPDEIELVVGTESLDISTYVTLGNSVIVGFVSSDPSVATVDSTGKVTPVQFGNATITVTLANGVVEILPIFVKEKIRLSTILMIAGIPVLSVGIGSVLILVKTRPVKIVQRVQGKQKKEKKEKKPKKTIVLPSDELTKTDKEL